MKRIGTLLAALMLLLMVPAVSAQDDTTVLVSETPELGEFLTDAEGMTLYLFTNDEPGVSNCSDDCLANWPAFSAEEPLTLPEGVPGTLGTITRDDGTTQVTYNDWPLYYWVGDEAPGDTNGQGVGDVWFVVPPGEETVAPGASPEASPAASPVSGDTTVLVAETDELGEFLTDAEGMTLYLFTNDTEGASTCEGDCLVNWPAFVAEEPLTLPEGVPGELTLIERPDGSPQVAYNGMPLYYYHDDVAPGDVTGQGKGDVWFVVEPGE
jgi:predicted lipoprotein with Yx(FWY)xxD motif